MTGVLRWLNPLTWLDLTGKDGRPSFAKLVLVAVLALAASGHALSDLTAALVVCASYGWKGLTLWRGTKGGSNASP